MVLIGLIVIIYLLKPFFSKSNLLSLILLQASLMKDIPIIFVKHIYNVIQFFPIIPQKGQISIILNIVPVLVITYLYNLWLSSRSSSKKKIYVVLLSIIIGFYIPLILNDYCHIVYPRYRWCYNYTLNILIPRLNIDYFIFTSTYLLAYSFIFMYLFKPIINKWIWLTCPAFILLSLILIIILLFYYWFSQNAVDLLFGGHYDYAHPEK